MKYWRKQGTGRALCRVKKERKKPDAITQPIDGTNRQTDKERQHIYFVRGLQVSLYIKLFQTMQNNAVQCATIIIAKLSLVFK